MWKVNQTSLSFSFSFKLRSKILLSKFCFVSSLFSSVWVSKRDLMLFTEVDLSDARSLKNESDKLSEFLSLLNLSLIWLMGAACLLFCQFYHQVKSICLVCMLFFKLFYFFVKLLVGFEWVDVTLSLTLT